MIDTIITLMLGIWLGTCSSFIFTELTRSERITKR